MKLSIVTTMYHSVSYLQEFYERISTTIRGITDAYELIFVNDGSPDNSLEVILDLQKKDPKIKIIDLSRNFGHHKAMMTGLSQAKGHYICLIDCDLEEAPELIENFYQELKTKQADVVYGVQKERSGNLFKRVTGKAYYRLVNKLTNVDLPNNLVTLRIMTKRYVESLLRHQEREINIACLWYSTGYKQIPFEINKLVKKTTTYTFSKKVSALVNAVTSFSEKPLVYIAYSGIVILIISILYILHLISLKLHGKPINGWASLIVSVWFFGGLIIFYIGIIGIYLSKMFIEVKQRPYTIIKDIYVSNN